MCRRAGVTDMTAMPPPYDRQQIVAATMRQMLGLLRPKEGPPSALYGVADLVEHTSPAAWTRCPLCWGVSCDPACVLAPLRPRLPHSDLG